MAKLGTPALKILALMKAGVAQAGKGKNKLVKR
jgi:hypothetical protein